MCSLGAAYGMRAGETPVFKFDPEPVRRAAERAKQLDYDRAIAQLSHAIKLDPKCARAYLVRFIAYTGRKQPGDEERAAADSKEYDRLSGKP